MPQDVLSRETLERIREIAVQQVALIRELRAALEADDTARVVRVAREIVQLEQLIDQRIQDIQRKGR